MMHSNGKKDRLTILVVDDMPEIRRIITHVLQHSLNATIVEAENGLDAISRVLDRKPDLIITDLSMPKMTGLEFVGFIQQRTDLSDIPVIVLTSESDEKTEVQALDLQVRAYLQKPFNPQQMVQTIRLIFPLDSEIEQNMPT